jgi:hypothetical protein
MLRTIKILMLLSFVLGLAGCGGKTGGGEDAIVDNGDGTIMNTLTSQMWTKKKASRFFSGEEAQEYAGKARVSGYDDWRLPTLDEFHTLYYAIDFGQGSVKKAGISSEGAIWVLRDETLVSGAWEREDTCCISRSFMETKSGRVWLVRP